MAGQQIRAELKVTSDLREFERELTTLFAKLSREMKIGGDFGSTLKDIEKVTAAMKTLDDRIKAIAVSQQKLQEGHKKLADASQKFFTQDVKNALSKAYGSQDVKGTSLENTLIAKHKARLLREAKATGQQLGEAQAAGMAKRLAQKDIHTAVLLALGPLADTKEQQKIQANAQKFFRSLKPGAEFTKEMRDMILVLTDARKGIAQTQAELDFLAGATTKAAKAQRQAQQSMAQGYKEVAKVAGESNRQTTALATAQAKALSDYAQKVKTATQAAQKAAQRGAYDPNLQRSAGNQVHRLGGMITALRTEQMGGMMTATQSAHADRQIAKAEELIRKWQNDIMPAISHIRNVKGAERTRRAAQMAMWDVEGRASKAFQDARVQAREDVFGVNPALLRQHIQDLVRQRAVYKSQATKATNRGDEAMAQQYQMLVTGLTSKIGSHGEALASLEWQRAKAGAAAMGAPGGFVNAQAQALAGGVGGLRSALDRAKIGQLGGRVAGGGAFRDIRSEYDQLEKAIADGRKRLKGKLSSEERVEVKQALKEALALQARYQQEMERLRQTEYANIQKHRKARQAATIKGAKEELEARKKARLEENLEILRGAASDPKLIGKMNRDQLARLREAVNEGRWARRKGYADVPDIAEIGAINRAVNSRNKELGRPSVMGRLWYTLTGRKPPGGGDGGGGGAHAYGNIQDTTFHHLNKRVTNISQLLGTSLYGMGIFGAASAITKGTISSAAEKESMVNTLAGLINTFAKFKTATGEAASSTENFLRAIDYSGQVYEDVRQKAANSILTTREMFDYFMSGAPQLMAKGLNTSQALDIVTAVSSLGKSMGLSSTAVQSDIRDLATGQVTVRSQVLRTMGFDKAQLSRARQEGPEALVKYFNKVMEGFAPALNRLSKLNQTAITRLTNALQQFGITIGEKMAPRLIPLLGKLQSMFEKWATDGTLDKFADSFGGAVESFAKSFLWFSNTIGPIVADLRVLLGGFITVIGVKFVAGLIFQTAAVQGALNSFVYLLGNFASQVGLIGKGLAVAVFAVAGAVAGVKAILDWNEGKRQADRGLADLEKRSAGTGYSEEQQREVDKQTEAFIALQARRGKNLSQIRSEITRNQGRVANDVSRIAPQDMDMKRVGGWVWGTDTLDAINLALKHQQDNILNEKLATNILAEAYASVYAESFGQLPNELKKEMKSRPDKFIKDISSLKPELEKTVIARLALGGSVRFVGTDADSTDKLTRELNIAGINRRSIGIDATVSGLDSMINRMPDNVLKATLASRKYGLQATQLGLNFRREQEGFAAKMLDLGGKPEEQVKLAGEIVNSQLQYEKSLQDLQLAYEDQIRTMRESIALQKDELQTRKDNLRLQKEEFDLNQRRAELDLIDKTSESGRQAWIQAARAYNVDNQAFINRRSAVANQQTNRQLAIINGKGDSWEVVAKSMGVSTKAPVALDFTATTKENLKRIGDEFSTHKDAILTWSDEMKMFSEILTRSSEVNAETAKVIDAAATKISSVTEALRPMPTGSQFYYGMQDQKWAPAKIGVDPKLKPHVQKAREEIAQLFGLNDIGGWRPKAVDMHGHPAGLALDAMVGKDKAKGDAIVAWAIQNKERLGLKYIIWQQAINTLDGRGFRAMKDRGSPTANHMDHPHLSFHDSVDGASKARQQYRVDQNALAAKAFQKEEEIERRREALIEADKALRAMARQRADENVSRRMDYRQASSGWYSRGLGQGDARDVFLMQQELDRTLYEYSNQQGMYAPGTPYSRYSMPERMASARRFAGAYEYFNLNPGMAENLYKNPSKYSQVLKSLGLTPSEIKQGLSQKTAGGFGRLGKAIEDEVTNTVQKLTHAKDMITGALAEFGNAIGRYTEVAQQPYQEASRMIGINLADIPGQMALDKLDRNLLQVRMSQIGLTARANASYGEAVKNARLAKPGDVSTIQALLGFSFEGVGQVLSPERANAWSSRLSGITDPTAWQSALSELFIEMGPVFGEKFAKYLAEQIGPLELERRQKEVELEKKKALRDDEFAYKAQVAQVRSQQEEKQYQRVFDIMANPPTEIRSWTDARGTAMESVSRQYESLQENAQLAVSAQMLADKGALIGQEPIMLPNGQQAKDSQGRPIFRNVYQYDRNIESNPNYYTDMQNSLISAGRRRLMNQMRGMNSAGMMNQSALRGVGGNFLNTLITNPIGVMNGSAFNAEGIGGIFGPVLDLQNQRQTLASQLMMTAAFSNVNPWQALRDPNLAKHVNVSGVSWAGGMPIPALKFDKWGAIKTGLGGLGGGLAGNYGGAMLGKMLFPGKDLAAISTGSSIGTSLGGMFAGALGMTGPWGMIAGGLVGGLLGGLFGGSKPDPDEERRKELNKQHQQRMEELLSRIDKSLRPQADYFRTIKGDVLYGTASRWYSGRAYAQLGLQGAIGGR